MIEKVKRVLYTFSNNHNELIGKDGIMADTIVYKKKKRCLEETIGFFDFAEIDGCIWGAAINYNALIKIDLKTMEPQYMGSFPGEAMYAAWLYRSVVRVGNRLIFAPFMAESIGEYDLETEAFVENEKLKESNRRFKFETAFFINSKVYLMPQRYPYIVVLDVINGKMTYLDCIREAFEQEKQNLQTVFLGVGTTDSKSHVYIPRRSSTDILKYDIESHLCEVVAVGTESSVLICSLIDDWLWLLPAHNEPLVKWNVKTKDKVVYSGLQSECAPEDAPYIRAIDCGEKIFFFRELAEKSLIYDKKTDSFEKMSVSYESKVQLVEKPWKGNYYFAKRLDNGKIVSVSKKDHFVVIVDVENGQISNYPLCLSEENRRKWSRNALLREYDEQTKALKESTEGSLECFIDFVESEMPLLNPSD